jgi:hypothetical protein
MATVFLTGITNRDKVKVTERRPVGSGAVSGPSPDNSGPSGSSIDQISGTGIVVRTSSWVVRSLTAPAAGLTITNNDGVSGNPTFALANDLAALEGLAANGLAARTGTDTWTVRTITAPAAGLTVSNGDGVSGNPTLALANDLAALEGLSGTGYAKRTGTDTWATATASGILDDISTTQGTILYRGASGWSALAPGTSGQYLKTLGAGADPAWAASTGSGDVVGPSSATDNALARYDGTTGKLLQDSPATLADNGVLTLATTTAGGLTNNTSTQPPYMLFAVGGSNKGLIGAVNQANDIITGAAAGDLCLRVITAGKSLRFSADNGTATQVEITSTQTSVNQLLAVSDTLTVNKSGAGGLTLNNTSSNPPYILFQVGASNKALFGVANGGGDIVTGSASGDLVLRTIGANAIRFSVDNGGTSAVAINSSGALVLSTALAVAYGGTASTALGTSLTNSGGTLNTIQGIRTTDAVQFLSFQAIGSGSAPTTSTSNFKGWLAAGVEPVFSFVDASQAANARAWDFTLSGGVFTIRVVNDAYSSASAALSITRSGTAISLVEFGAGIKTPAPSGGTAQTWKLGSYVAGAPSATGYAQIEINGTAYKVLVST